LSKADATENSSYGGSIANNASDPDDGDILSFSKQNGAGWLSVWVAGDLSGTPINGDVGRNEFTVRVEDYGCFPTRPS
jgi:hypothetical protein